MTDIKIIESSKIKGGDAAGMVSVAEWHRDGRPYAIRNVKTTTAWSRGYRYAFHSDMEYALIAPEPTIEELQAEVESLKSDIEQQIEISLVRMAENERLCKSMQHIHDYAAKMDVSPHAALLSIRGLARKALNHD